jgi:hypothetical protein
MDQKIAVVLQRLGVDKILLAGVAARRGMAPLCRRMHGRRTLTLPLSRRRERGLPLVQPLDRVPSPTQWERDRVRVQPQTGFFGRPHFVLDKNRDDVLKCKNYVMGRCASRVPAHFIFAAQGSAKRPTRRQLQYPNVQRLPPVAGWTQSGVDPKRVEAGINRLLLPCPARLRPADHRQHPLTPAVQLGKDPPGPRFMGALALGPGRGHGSRCASLRAARKVQARHRL